VADQAHPAQNEGAHDDFADIAFGGHKAAEVGPFHAYDPRTSSSASADQSLAVIEEIEFAGELPLAVDRDDLRLAPVAVLENFDGSLENEEKIYAALSSLE
jgi:hypothetical protein